MKFVIPDYIDIPEERKLQIKAMGGVIYDDLPNSPEEIIERCKDATIITACYIDITPGIIDALKSLRYIVVPAVGYEWVDVKYASGRGITTLNCPTYNAQAVAEQAFALLFSLQRHIPEAQKSLRAGKWESTGFRGTELSGKQMGVVGRGNVGTRIIKTAEAMGIKVVSTNSHSSSQELNDLLKTSDIICVCASLNGQTRGMLDKKRLGLLKNTATFVNVSRGAIIDQQELYNVLAEGRIMGAALDVFDNEPRSGSASEAIISLANLPNVVATPHIAYNTQETAERLGKELFECFQACLKGEPINVVS